jgi:hypothetical protein
MRVKFEAWLIFLGSDAVQQTYEDSYQLFYLQYYTASEPTKSQRKDSRCI